MPITHIPYFPDNIEGQALLDNFTRSRRVLKYRDNDKIATRILRGMPLYETELLETVSPSPLGEGRGEANLLLRGECLSACAYLKDRGIKIDLVYIDPPFASGADYAKKVYLRRNPKVAAAIAQAEEELAFDELKAFEEKMYGDIWNKEDYLNWMFENLMAIKSVMSETASIFVHLDYHIAHYVKILMDEIFGEDNFLNEIIWKRKQATSYAAKKFGVATDTLFWYSKSENYLYNSEFSMDDKNTKEYISERYIYKTPEGRVYKLGDLGNPLNRPNLKYEYKGCKPPANGWAVSLEKMKEMDAQGRLEFPKKVGGRLMRRQFLDEYEGQLVQNLWLDIFIVNSQAEERVDYATQKPEALLERIINTASDAGMTVADFFGGSGVTAAVSARLGRRFVHADVGINSIQTTRDRLRSAGAAFEIREVKDGVTLYRNPQQTMDNLHRFIEGLRNEDPLPAFWEGYFQDSKLGRVPVYLPNLLDHTTKVLDVAWMARIVNEAMPELPDGTKKVVIFYVDIEDETALKKYIAEQRETAVDIELRDLKPILEQAILPDEVSFLLKNEENGGFRLEIESFLSDRLRASIDQYNLRRQQNLLQKARRNGNADETGDDAAEVSTVKISGKFEPLTFSENGLELIEMLSLDCTADTGAWHSDAELKIDKNSFVVRDGKKTKEFWDGSIACDRRPLRLKVRNIAGDETVVVICTNRNRAG